MTTYMHLTRAELEAKLAETELTERTLRYESGHWRERAVIGEALEKIVGLARTFLACHDAFMLRQERATAFAMKDAADALRAALAAGKETDREGGAHGSHV